MDVTLGLVMIYYLVSGWGLMFPSGGEDQQDGGRGMRMRLRRGGAGGT